MEQHNNKNYSSLFSIPFSTWYQSQIWFLVCFSSMVCVLCFSAVFVCSQELLVVRLDVILHHLGRTTHRRYRRRLLGHPSGAWWWLGDNPVHNKHGTMCFWCVEPLIMNTVCPFWFLGSFWLGLEFFAAYRSTWETSHGSPATARWLSSLSAEWHVILYMLKNDMSFYSNLLFSPRQNDMSFSTLPMTGKP
jgi:hypothetical protein